MEFSQYVLDAITSIDCILIARNTSSIWVVTLLLLCCRFHFMFPPPPSWHSRFRVE